MWRPQEGALPVVMTLHSEPALSTPLQRAGYRWLAARADQLVACGDSVARSFAGWRTARPLCTVVNGIADPATPPAAAPEVARLRAALGVPREALVFATVGRLVPVKGYGHLLAALAAALPSLPEPVRLLMFGDGPDLPALRAQAAAAGLAERVVFAGARDHVPRLLAAADVVVFSSTCEGLPMALIEAMAAALQRAAADPELRARLGSAARARFLAAYTAPRMVAAYEAIYRDTWNRAPRRQPRAEAPAA